MNATFSRIPSGAMVGLLIVCIITMNILVFEAAAQTDLQLVCETFCSETKLRTASARLSWVPTDKLRTAGTTLSNSRQRLEATVFKGGFEKELYIKLPLFTPRGDIKAAQAEALEGETRRAYQLNIEEVGPVSELKTFGALQKERNPSETAAIIDNLEPGLNYTWRLVIEDAGGDIVSHTVTCQAPVCPADMRKEEQ